MFILNTLLAIPSLTAVSHDRWAFQVQLAPNSGVEFAPGEFAAESEAMRDRCLEQLGEAMDLESWRKCVL